MDIVRAAGSALQNLAAVVPERKVRRDVVFLMSELLIIAVAAEDWIASHDVHNPNAQAWANSLGELAYDVEDWANLFALRLVPNSGILRWIGRGGHKLTTTLPTHHIIELQGLKERVVELRRRIRSIPSVPAEQADELVDPRLTAGRFVDVGCLVGFDGPIEEVTKLVTGAGGKAQLKVVSIVGMAGSGKTTLAAAVYQQFTQHNCFQFHAFVSVGRKPDAAKKALQDMLSKLDHGHPEEPFKDELKTRLRKILGNKSCLIVVDDLWSMEDCEDIRICFPEDSVTGSRIITTTRNLELAQRFCRGSSDCIYSIGPLNEVDSKRLILDRAFGIGHGCPKHLEEVLAQVTRRCSGLPLALVTVPSMLEDKSSKEEWDRLVGSRWSSRPDAKVMKQILNLSFSDLPQDLKPCLLDVSIFPENSKVDVDRLMRRWIAEGYVQEWDHVEDTARSYIYELISRNMVQQLPPVHGAPRYCMLHPVIHDFVVCKSMEDNFVSLVDDQDPLNSSNCTVYRRLSVQSSKHDRDLMPYDGMDLSHVRSITVFGQAIAAPRLTNLCVVRVLDLEGCVGPVCLDDLDKLPLLRYLSLKGTDVSELPAALWELRFLESLDVRSTMVKQLPPSIVGLRHSLRTLLFGHEGMINSVETATRIAEDIHDCYRLENVTTIDLREHPASFVKALGDLKDLRMLKITWSFDQCTEGAYCEALLSSMEKWRKLRSLTIHCGLSCCMEFLGSLSYPPEKLEKFIVTTGVFVSVPKWIQRLDFLSFLQITICKMETDDLRILMDIPQLQSLILGLDFVPRKPIVIENEGFSKLLRFSVNCPVPWLTFQPGTEGVYRKSLLSSMTKWRKLRSLTVQCGLGCSMEFLGSLSDRPEQLEEFKVTAGVFVCVPRWIERLRYLSFLQITVCKIGTDDLNLLRDLPQLQCLILGLDFVPRNAIMIESDGFSELLSFSVNCPMPWLTFQAGAMPKLTHLQLEFCSGSTNPESVPSGISNLQRLTEVVLLYNQKWCADSSSVRMTADAVKRQVAKHRNLIDLIINGTKADVQKVDEEMKSTTKIQSGDAGEEIARTTVEMNQGEIEIEIEAECDKICSTY